MRLSSLRFSHFCCSLWVVVLSEKTSVPVSGRRDPLNAWRSQYHAQSLERGGRQCEESGEPKYAEKHTACSQEYEVLFTPSNVCIVYVNTEHLAEC